MNASQTSLVGFAVLRANYDARAHSYVDNFRTFALDILAQQSTDVSANHIATNLRSRFGLTIPDLVVTRILKRAAKDGLAARNENKFRITDKGLKSAPRVSSDIARYERQQTELVEKYRSFVKDNYPEHLQERSEEAAGELARYLEIHAVPLLAQSLMGHPPINIEANHTADYIISKFITALAEIDQTGFGYVEDAVKGAILASVVTLDTSSFQQSLDSLTIYLDTPVLINALGFSGHAQEQATLQMLELGRSLGASIRCFDHSMRELDGVLASAEAVLRHGNRRKEGLRPVDAHFQEVQFTPSDIALERDRLPTSLNDLGITPVPKPDTYSKYGLDEDELEELIQEHVNYRSEGTRRYDVDSLSAIHRLRKGSSPAQIERCNHLLITDNTGLVRAIEKLKNERHQWPLAMTDGALAAMLWVRSPTVGGDLPRKQILATAYAGMQPDNHLWAKYLKEVTLLEERGVFDENDAAILRATTVGRTALMEETLGDEGRVSEESAVEVLKRIKREIEEPLLDKLEQANRAQKISTESANTVAQSWIDQTDALEKATAEIKAAKKIAEDRRLELERMEKKDRERDQRLTLSAEATARRIVNWTLSIFALPLIGFAILNYLNPPWLAKASGVVGTILLILGLATAVVAICQCLFEGSVRGWFKPIERRLAKGILRRRRANIGLTPSPVMSTDSKKAESSPGA